MYIYSGNDQSLYIYIKQCIYLYSIYIYSMYVSIYVISIATIDCKTFQLLLSSS